MWARELYLWKVLGISDLGAAVQHLDVHWTVWHLGGMRDHNEIFPDIQSPQLYLPHGYQ